MFFQPSSVEEALALKRQLGSDAAFLAGGTDLVVLMNHGQTPARAMIDLSHVPGMDIVSTEETADGTVYVAGGLVTHTQLGNLPVRCIAEAALSVGGAQIRNRGTVAGNLATASPAGDVSTALLALDAHIELRNIERSRTLPLCEFFLDYRKTALAPDEIIASVTFPANWKTGWYKLGKRASMNISMVCCAVGVSSAKKFHVAFGSVGPFPLRATRTEEFLGEHAEELLDPAHSPDELAAQAARIATDEVRPITDFRGSEEYRREMSGVLLKKVLRQLRE
jgi:CO/xanthine dehydrogenase FAD-binding subunit